MNHYFITARSPIITRLHKHAGVPCMNNTGFSLVLRRRSLVEEVWFCWVGFCRWTASRRAVASSSSM